MLPENTSFVTDETSLRKLHHQPMSRATDKVLRALDRHCRQIISLSPFCVVSTQGPNGADISPRGDPPGFVRELDERTLLLPDRRASRFTARGKNGAKSFPASRPWMISH